MEKKGKGGNDLNKGGLCMKAKNYSGENKKMTNQRFQDQIQNTKTKN